MALALLAAGAGPAGAQIRINEILPNPAGTDTGLNELVEIYNAGNTTIDVTGWGIDDAVTISQAAVRARIPEDFDPSCGTSPILLPGEFRVVHAQVTGSAYLNNTGDDVYLVSDRLTNATVVQLVTYPDASGQSGNVWACVPNGSTNFDWRTNSMCATNGSVGDATPPATVSDLAATPGAFPGEILLTWTAPGDDGNTGTASNYIVHVDHAPLTAGTFDAAGDVDRWITEFAPHPAGTPESLYVAGLDPDSTWYFALITQDEVPNNSGVSNSPGSPPGAGTRLDPDLGYSVFYGNLHSHTSYSDGVLTPPDAFDYARNGAPTPLDFLAVTEHNHSGAGLDSLGAYHLALQQAAAANDDGGFVAIAGQEWGVISSGGHVNLFESPALFGWQPGWYDVYNAEGDYVNVYRRYVENPPPSYPPVAEWCHPGSGDFNGYAVTDTGKSVVHLMAMISGPAFSTSTTESDQGSTTGNEALFQDALRKGYRVSPTGDQDNHNATWGASTPSRTAVLASGLTKSEILNALAARRCYATMDHNAVVQLSGDGHAMGEAWTSAEGIRIAVRVQDPDLDETVSRIDLYRGITGSSNAVVIASNVGSPDFAWREHDVFPQGTEAHYYARIQMSNNAQIWTGPIYVTYDPTAATAVEAPRPAEAIRMALGPNPTLGRVEARFTLPADARFAELAVFDASGRRVHTLLAGPLAAGPHLVHWSGADDRGGRVPSGVFFLRLSVGPVSVTRKVLVLR